MSFVDSFHYNNLPSLGEAHHRFQDPRVVDLMTGPIRDIFLKYGAQSTHSLYLQHHHHHIQDGEAVVKTWGSGCVMDETHIRDAETMGNKIVPVTWMGKSLAPMEFAIVPKSVDVPALPQGFKEALYDVLSANECIDLFGIDSLAKKDWAEMNIGNASVVIPSNGLPVEGYIPVAFRFDGETPGFVVHGRCGVDHKHTSKPSN